MDTPDPLHVGNGSPELHWTQLAITVTVKHRETNWEGGKRKNWMKGGGGRGGGGWEGRRRGGRGRVGRKEEGWEGEGGKEGGGVNLHCLIFCESLPHQMETALMTSLKSR